MSRESKDKRGAAVKTITHVPLIGGGLMRLNWTEIALVTAELLKRIPAEPPPSAKPSYATGLLGVIFETPDHWESRFPERHDALDGLRGVERLLEGYAKTGTVQHDQADGTALAEAWASISAIVKAGWAWPDIRATLPILISSIARTASVESSMKAKKPRPRKPNALKKAMLKTMRAHPGLSWKELLMQMKGEGVVRAFDAQLITWQDEDGRVQTMATGTFINWKASA